MGTKDLDISYELVRIRKISSHIISKWVDCLTNDNTLQLICKCKSKKLEKKNKQILALFSVIKYTNLQISFRLVEARYLFKYLQEIWILDGSEETYYYFFSNILIYYNKKNSTDIFITRHQLGWKVILPLKWRVK